MTALPAGHKRVLQVGPSYQRAGSLPDPEEGLSAGTRHAWPGDEMATESGGSYLTWSQVTEYQLKYRLHLAQRPGHQPFDRVPSH
jgi:hypothetical protein